LERHADRKAGVITPAQRQALAVELGRFVRLLHDRGVLQVDLHGSNLLMRVPASGRPEFRLVDLDGIKLHRFVRWPDRVANLITLHVYLATRSTRADRLRFLRAYLGEGDAERLPALARRIESASGNALKNYRRERAERCLKVNRDFTRTRGAGLRWQTRRSVPRADLEMLIDSPNRTLANKDLLIKNSPSSTVGRTQGFVLKRFNHKKFFNWFKDLFRPSRAQEAFLKAYHLELCGIPTPVAVGFAEERSAGFLSRSYLITREVPGALHIEQLLQRHPKLPLAERRDLLRRMARLVASLHDAGFSHRDLKHQNILIGQAPERRLYLIDLDGLNDVGDVSASRALRDLQRLDRSARDGVGISQRERLRFYAEYRRALRDRRLREALSR
jgi:tRNA A-37 threonylcarbamoyl transferase component Bud32